MRYRILTSLLLLFLVVAGGFVHAADDWLNLATVSMTNPTTPKLSNRSICYSDGTDIACDNTSTYIQTGGLINAYALQVSGYVSAGTIHTSGTVMVSNTVYADQFVGDGSLLSGLASGDRIVSDTTSIVVNDIMDTISFTTAGNLAMVISNTGYVGIGTDNPLEQLHVNGDRAVIRISHLTSPSYVGLNFYEGTMLQANLTSVGSTFSQAYRRNDLTIAARNGGDIALQTEGDGSGRVGIGAGLNSPSSTLHISGTLIISDGGESCDANREGGLKYDFASNAIQYCDGVGPWAPLAAGTAASATEALRLVDGDGDTMITVENPGDTDTISFTTAGGERMMIGADGNVGIATSAPSRTLTVSGTTWTTLLELSEVTGAAAPISISTENGPETDPKVGTLELGKWCTSDGSMVNCTEDNPADNMGDHSASQTIVMNGNDITGAGVINADTVSATYGSFQYLSVTTTAHIAQLCDENGANCNDVSEGFGDPDRIVSDTTTIIVNDIMDTISFTTAGGERMMIGADGNVGIGTSSPNASLTVVGTVSATRLHLASLPGGAGEGGDAGDNLGNHMAEQDLQMGGYNISNVGAITGTTVSTTYGYFNYLSATSAYLPTLSGGAAAFNSVSSTLVSASNISATTAHIAQLCDETGANCNDLSAGLAINTLNDIGDVSATSPFEGAFLRYSASVQSWTTVSPGMVVSTTSMMTNWPDAIMCTLGSQLRVLYLRKVDSGAEYSDPVDADGGRFTISFNDDFTYSSHSQFTGADCLNKSIPQLYSEGKAFNFLGNNGADASEIDDDRIVSDTTTIIVNDVMDTISFTTAGNLVAMMDSSGNMGIGTSNPTASLTVVGTVSSTRLRLAAVAGGAGEGGTGGDNLGNHTAEQALDMAGYDINNVGQITATSVLANHVSATNISGTNVQVGQSVLSCGSDIEGAIRYNATSNTLQVCNAAGWVSLSSQTISILDDVGDVSASAPGDNYVLAYDTSGNVWYPASVASLTVSLPGSQTFTSNGTFIVPEYGTLTVKVWGGGGGGGSGGGGAHGTSGGQSQFDSPVPLVANGGIRGLADGGSGGAGGTASGGDVNTTGGSGASSGGNRVGGNSPNGGLGGQSIGNNGSIPGGGGAGGNDSNDNNKGGGGGAGGYSAKTFAAGELTPGAAIAVTIGAGGPRGSNGGDGARGEVQIEWTAAAEGDNLGNHTAEETLDMSGYNISNVGILTGATVSSTYGYFNYLSATTGYIPALTNSSFSGNAIAANSISVTSVSATNISGTSIQVGQSGLTCGSDVEGAIRYNTTSDTLQICNSVGWVSLSSSTAASIETLDDIGDVDAPSPNVDSSLVWNGTNWVAGPALTGCMAGDTSIIPAMSSNSQGGYVSSGSSQYSGTYTYAEAFDGVSTGTNGWLTANGQLTGYLQIQMPVAVEVISYAITARSSSPDGSPNTWTLEGSNNGSDWDVVDSRSGITGWTTSERREFAVSSPAAYSYYRIDVTANDGFGSYVSITELDLYKMNCAGADNMGDHSASQTIVMNGNDITGAGMMTADWVSSTNISGTAAHVAEICDESGGNCIDVSGGFGSGDRIVSGTLAMIANSATSYISLSTAGTTWGYLNSGLSYLPQVMANRVSATNVSATVFQLTPVAGGTGEGGGSTDDGDWTVSGADMYNANGGNVGIGITTPSTTLHVSGTLTLSGASGSETCDDTYYGRIRYDSATGKLQICRP